MQRFALVVQYGCHRTIVPAALLLLSALNIPALATDDPSVNNPFESADHNRDNALKEMRVPQKDARGDSAALHTQKAAEEKQNTAAAPQSRYIVKFKDDVSLEEIYTGLKDYSFTVIGSSSHHMFTVPSDNIDTVKESFGDKIEFVEENKQIKTEAITTDPYVQEQ